MLDKSKLIRKRLKSNGKRVSISIKVPFTLAKWMKDSKFSPTAIFIETCKELGWKDESEKNN